LGEKVFRVKTVPNPVVKVANKHGGSIERSKLLNAAIVEVQMENFDFDLSFEVVGFTVGNQQPDGHIEEYKSNSARFTQEQKKLIKEVSRGFPIYLKDIKVKAPDGSVRDLGQLVFTVW
jgi:hypothetical protein